MVEKYELKDAVAEALQILDPDELDADSEPTAPESMRVAEEEFGLQIVVDHGRRYAVSVPGSKGPQIAKHTDWIVLIGSTYMVFTDRKFQKIFIKSDAE